MPGADSDLLRKHQPVLRYDSNECYFADSAAEWTDYRGNRLKRGGAVLAKPGEGEAGLSLGTLGLIYPSGRQAREADLIDCADDDYVTVAAELHEDPNYRNRMYGRAVREPNGGALWLQYWFFYFYNDFNLIGKLIKAGLHEGDWEMVQLRIGADGTPDLAAYAQHTEAQVKEWKDVERADADDARPVVYVARGSHASYFSAGVHPLGTPGAKWLIHGFDHANGKRETPELGLQEIELDADGWGWVRWPGLWGGTTGGPVPLIDDGSPRGPLMHDQWDDPSTLLPKAEQKEARVAAAPAPQIPTLAAVEVAREPAGLAITYEAQPVAGEKFVGLVVTLNSRDEKKVPPRTRTIPLSTTSGTAHLEASLDPQHRYDVTVSAAFDPYLATEAQQIDLPPEPAP
jgi:hypothetical protein